MKKLLLLSALGLLAAQGVSADDAASKYVKNLDYLPLAISPNGKYAGSQDINGIALWDLETSRIVANVYVDEDSGVDHYSIGIGNFVNDLGQFTGSNGYGSNDEACVYKDGKWTVICSESDRSTSSGNGITNDGKRICGYAASGDLLTTVRPVYWDLEADGSWSIHDLPYPATDYAGQPIQNCTAICISNDGKTILGQVVAGNGMNILPVLFTMDDKGEWSYKVLGEEYANPDNVEFPPYPTKPNPTDYMTADEKAAYDEALAEWGKNPLGGPRPQPEDFINDEAKLAEYKAAMQDYNTKLSAYNDVFYQVFENSKSFVQGQMRLSSDGMLAAATVENVDADTWEVSYDVVKWVTHDLTKTVYKDVALATWVLNDGTILAGDGPDQQTMAPQEAYILQKDATEFISLNDYIKAQDADALDFLAANFIHKYFDGYDDDYNMKWEEVLALGIPLMSEDHSVLTGSIYNMWVDQYLDPDNYEPTEDDQCMTVGYVLKMPADNSGVKGVAVEDNSKLPVEFYTIDGLRVNKPAAGQLVIRRQGSNVSKVIVK